MGVNIAKVDVTDQPGRSGLTSASWQSNHDSFKPNKARAVLLLSVINSVRLPSLKCLSVLVMSHLLLSCTLTAPSPSSLRSEWTIHHHLTSYYLPVSSFGILWFYCFLFHVVDVQHFKKENALVGLTRFNSACI